MEVAGFGLEVALLAGLGEDMAALAHRHQLARFAEAAVQQGIGAQGLGNPMQGATHLTAAQIADLNAGSWYINIHTAANPNGEIRGQVTPAH